MLISLVLQGFLTVVCGPCVCRRLTLVSFSVFQSIHQNGKPRQLRKQRGEADGVSPRAPQHFELFVTEMFSLGEPSLKFSSIWKRDPASPESAHLSAQQENAHSRKIRTAKVLKGWDYQRSPVLLLISISTPLPQTLLQSDEHGFPVRHGGREEPRAQTACESDSTEPTGPQGSVLILQKRARFI